MIELHIPANYFHPELPGGSLQYFRYAPYLLERGVRMVVHTPLRPHHSRRSFEIQGIQVNRLPVPEGLTALEEMVILTRSAAREIKRRGVERPCLQPIGAVADSVAGVAQLWKIRFRGVPVTRHFVQVPDRSHLTLRYRLRRRLVWAPYSAMLMCSSEMGRAFRGIAGIGERRIRVIPNGIDTEVFRPPEPGKEAELRAKLKLPAGGRIVLYVGSVIARKGVDLLIEAWPKVLEDHPDATLVMVGSETVRPTFRGEQARSEAARFIDEIRKRMAESGISDRVILTGEVDNVEEYYRAADVFAFASRQEGLPSAVLEAMASGLASVLTPFNGFPADGDEYGIAGRHFLKVPHEPAEIASNLCHLLDDDGLRAKIGSEACQWIQSTQAMEKAADLLAEVYHELV